MSFPKTRMRRLRSSAVLRDLTAEVRLTPENLIYPLFLKEGLKKKAAIQSMPGQFQHSLQSGLKEIEACIAVGIQKIIVFGIPHKKDSKGTEAANPTGMVQNFIKTVKKSYPQVLIIADVCLCEYTSHAHCGHMRGDVILNDSTLEALAEIALSYAKAGADIIAPSDMMDGRVKIIRAALDKAGYQDLPILSYAAKYNSGFYGPFRDAAENTPTRGDRSTYQMNPANAMEAMKEVSLDIEEGADLILIKPASTYLDIVSQAKEKFQCPVGVYNVSGEYAMVKAAAQNDWIDEKRVVMESLTCMLRAGATFIVTYWAKDAATWLKK